MEKTRDSLSRRNMLIVGGGAFAALGAVIAAPYKAAISRRARELVRATPFRRSESLASAGYDQWASEVGSTFTVAGAQGLILAGVRPMESSGSRPNGTRTQAFVAMFDARRGSLPGDLIYTVTHAEYGPFQIFLSAGTDPRYPNRMLAIFN